MSVPWPARSGTSSFCPAVWPTRTGAAASSSGRVFQVRPKRASGAALPNKVSDSPAARCCTPKVAEGEAGPGAPSFTAASGAPGGTIALGAPGGAIALGAPAGSIALGAPDGATTPGAPIVMSATPAALPFGDTESLYHPAGTSHVSGCPTVGTSVPASSAVSRGVSVGTPDIVSAILPPATAWNSTSTRPRRLKRRRHPAPGPISGASDATISSGAVWCRLARMKVAGTSSPPKPVLAAVTHQSPGPDSPVAWPISWLRSWNAAPSAAVTVTVWSCLVCTMASAACGRRALASIAASAPSAVSKAGPAIDRRTRSSEPAVANASVPNGPIRLSAQPGRSAALSPVRRWNGAAASPSAQGSFGPP